MPRVTLSSCMLLTLLVSATFCRFDWSRKSSDMLEREISNYHADLSDNLNEQASHDLGLASNIGKGAGRFHCTGGIDPSSMGETEYLKAFRMSKCSPVIAIAGIMGTKLQVMINCEELKEYHLDIFKGCGWSTCGNSLFGTKPKPEYAVWIPSLISPFTILSPFQNHKTCLASVLGLQYKFDTNSNTFVLNKIKGIKIKAMGYTPETRQNSDCGYESVSNLLPVSNFMSPSKFKMFNHLKNELLFLGYKLGLTTVALPYDWREPFAENDVSKRFMKLIKGMAEISKKRVTIVAHSMGNINLLTQFRVMGQDFKDKFIEKYFAVAPPYIGAPIAVHYLLGGKPDFYAAGLGMNFWLFKELSRHMPSIYDLMPRKVWDNFQNTSWMKSIMNRIKQEKNQKVSDPQSAKDDIVNNIYPKPTEKCNDKIWTTRETKCDSGLDDFKEIAEISGKVFTIDNIEEFLRENSFENHAAEFYAAEKKARANYDTLKNPGVETVIMYGTNNITPRKFIYNQPIKPRAIKDDSEFIFADSTVNTLGDGTVVAVSAITPGFKWADEFNRKAPGAKPVTFVEICGSYNTKMDIRNDGETPKNQFFGVPCSCMPGSEKNCNHIGMVGDTGLVEFIIKNLFTKPSTVVSESALDGMSDSHIRNFVQNCDLLEKIED